MKKFLKKHVKLIITLIVIVAIVVAISTMNARQAAMPPTVDVVTLERADLINSVNVTGTVESKTSKKIFTTLTLPVDKKMVEIGDTVKEGDVLCELDTESLEDSIKQQRTAAAASSAINQNSIELAQKNYDKALGKLEDDNNDAIKRAEQAVESAYISYEGSVDLLQNARQENRWTDNDLTKDALDRATTARDQAYASYESAKENLELARQSAKEQVDAYNDSINTNKIASSATNSQWVTVKNLEKNLEKAIITAPVSGVVTGVYVTEGAPATGLLFVIEDVNDLQIKATLKEYDLSLVKEGNIAEIKSDVTGENIYNGKLSKIAPTTKKTATGDNMVGANGEFDSEINVTDHASGLKIGSKARVDIIYDKKDDVLTVPFEAITVDAENNPIVLIAEEQEGGVYKLKGIKVEQGMEGDFDVEITSTELKEGDKVIRNAKDLAPDMIVMLSDALAEQPAGAFGGMQHPQAIDRGNE